jgi:hypothetical protein
MVFSPSDDLLGGGRSSVLIIRRAIKNALTPCFHFRDTLLTPGSNFAHQNLTSQATFENKAISAGFIGANWALLGRACYIVRHCNFLGLWAH